MSGMRPCHRCAALLHHRQIGCAGTAAAETAAAALARLALELQAGGGPAGAPLHGLLRLQRARGGLLAPHAPVLALLAARCTCAGELGAALALLAREAARPGGGFAGARAGAEAPSRGGLRRLGRLWLSAVPCMVLITARCAGCK